MAHLRIGLYTITRGTLAELVETTRAGMLPIFERQPGFISYQLIDAGNATALSVSSWETEAEAEAATGEAADWVHESIADRVHLEANYVGDDLLAEPG